MYWTLEGFYDAAIIVPLVICARYLHRRRGLAAGVAYCSAAFFHFRAFFHAPWAIWALGSMLRNRFWRGLRPRHAIAIVLALACAGASLATFWLDWDSLKNVIANNPLRYPYTPHDQALLWNFKVVVAVCGLAFIASRAWLDLLQVAWLAIVAVKLREFYYWHMLVSTSWIAAPASRPLVRAVRLAFVLTTIAILFHDPVAPEWLWMLRKGS
jgi:hypothetical protein